MEFVKCFTPQFDSQIFRFYLEKRVNRTFFGKKKMWILDVLLIYFDQIVSVFANF